MKQLASDFVAWSFTQNHRVGCNTIRATIVREPLVPWKRRTTQRLGLGAAKTVIQRHAERLGGVFAGCSPSFTRGARYGAASLCETVTITSWRTLLTRASAFIQVLGVFDFCFPFSLRGTQCAGHVTRPLRTNPEIVCRMSPRQNVSEVSVSQCQTAIHLQHTIRCLCHS